MPNEKTYDEGKVADLQDEYGLSEREAEVVLDRTAGGKGDVEAAAAQLKSERVGPSAIFDEENPPPRANEPGGHVAPPSVNAAPTPATAGANFCPTCGHPLRDTPTGVTAGVAGEHPEVPPAELTPRKLAEVGEPVNDEPDDLEGETGVDTEELDSDGDGQVTDDELRAASEEALIRWVEIYPSEATRVASLENEREYPREDVLDACGFGGAS